MEAGGSSREGKPFAFPDGNVGALDAAGVAGLIGATADIAVVLDDSGKIIDLSLGHGDFMESRFDEWVGQPWIDTVTAESKPKVAEMLSDASQGITGHWRQLNHQVPGDLDIPVRYMLLKLSGSGNLIAVGQDQRVIASLQQRLVEAQQAVEREYSRLRLAETRYRLLFQLTNEPVLIVESASMKIRECNPAAAAVLGDDAKKIVGRALSQRLSNESRAEAERYLERVRVDGHGDDIALTLADGAEVAMSASLFRQDNAPYFLIRFNVASDEPKSAEVIDYSLAALIENMPDAFVVTDAEQNIVTANTAFLDLAEIASIEQVRGERVDRWLGRTEVDFRVLTKSLEERGAVRRYATAVRGELGATEEVEVSVVSVHSRQQKCHGFVFRQVALSGLGPATKGDADLHKSVEKLAELVGRVPLKDIVRETTDMIERMCIEAALNLTGDNRASAADVLGLSRQSLYVKLRRFGIREFEPD